MISIGFFGIVFAILLQVWSLLLHWISILAAPLKEYEMLWIIVPIWINWFFTEFFVEKHGTTFGNAVTNGVIPILAALDWSRYLYRLLSEGFIMLTFGVVIKFLMVFATLAYGIFVIAAGIRIRQIVFFVGRIRWITYILLMVTPIIYGVIKFDWYTLLAIVVFFPLYWWVIEMFDRITPEPAVYRKEHNS